MDLNYRNYESYDLGETPELEASGFVGKILLGGTVARGDVLYSDETAGAFIAALGDAAGTSPVLCMALEAGVAGEYVPCLFKGVVYRGVTVSGSGAILYLSEATAGAMTRTAPSTTGNVVQKLGIYMDGQVLFDPSIDMTVVPA
jgi:hypothetical protein